MSKSTRVDHDDCIRDDERGYVCPNGCKCDCHGPTGRRGVAQFRVDDRVCVAGYLGTGVVTAVDRFGDVTVRFMAVRHNGDGVSLFSRYIGKDEK